MTSKEFARFHADHADDVRVFGDLYRIRERSREHFFAGRLAAFEKCIRQDLLARFIRLEKADSHLFAFWVKSSAIFCASRIYISRSRFRIASVTQNLRRTRYLIC